jgi:AAA+ superfamily predicted ATPase
MDPTVIVAIKAAADAAPDNLELRLHLVSLLANDGQPVEVLEQCGVILSRQPDHLEALAYAADAAMALGDSARAEGFRRLHRALGGLQARQPDPPVAGPPATDAGETAALHGHPAGQGAAPADSGRVVPLRVINNRDFEADSDDRWEVARPTITLSDVAGMEVVKRRLNVAFLAPLKNPELRKTFAMSLRGGLLLYGPPGCGKTYIARATAGELRARFLSVGLSDVLDMWLGKSERNLHEIFEIARRKAPCVLFFDEVDALGRKRSLGRGGGDHTIHQLLSELDGVNDNNEGLFVLAATNHPWDVDAALRRPGRLDRTVLVLPPDRPARVAVLNLHLRGRPVQGVDVAWLAERTEDYSGADLAHLCETATETALEDSIAGGTARPITMADFKRALNEVKPSTRPWLEMARNYAMFANEGGQYDGLLEYLRTRRML